eukprot:CAMPEP_0171185568 /NCGR_PEP_ID=MMETSP0790-20130122/16367_1 /TAXON_ID=2925 /ORGANISM="Alexandrium catenella, Strain OF101" /LENGTH=81 /DNA_ID=CAMNT_0011650591 /DNA_START=23 /DNA_END=264 /DNA_ORIENTATION=-
MHGPRSAAVASPHRNCPVLGQLSHPLEYAPAPPVPRSGLAPGEVEPVRVHGVEQDAAGAADPGGVGVAVAGEAVVGVAVPS